MADSESRKWWRLIDRSVQIVSDCAKGSKLAVQNYRIDLPIGSNVVNIIDVTAGKIKNAGKWVLRFDKPHVHTPYEHININPRIAKISRDPHIQISPKTLEAARSGAATLKKLNDFLIPIIVAADCARIGYNVYKDVQHDTSRNTIKAASSVVGGWSGGYAGSAVGATVLSVIFPGIGTIVGGLVGGVTGGIYGAIAAENTADTISDKYNLDMRPSACNKCNKQFHCRMYMDESCSFCSGCRHYFDTVY